MTKTDKITWTKVDPSDSNTWPSKDHVITVIVKDKRYGYWYNAKSNIFTGQMHIYKTIAPRFRTYFSMQKHEFMLEEIDYWAVINTKLD